VLCATANINYQWKIIANPTIVGTFEYSGITGTPLDVAYGDGSQTISGGHVIDSGYASNEVSLIDTLVQSSLKLGAKIDGTADTFVLSCVTMANTGNMYGSLTVRQLS
jgi:hypothetical protein